MDIIDFHSHILPEIDDGSQSAEMSRQMLELSGSQGVTAIVATPHFYAAEMTLQGFLKERRAAYDRICDDAQKLNIRLICGAETAFFSGMSDVDGLEELTIAETSLILLEMPFRAWNSSDIREIEKMLDRGLKPVIAHVERFYPYQRDKRIFDSLYSLPVLVQVNAEALLNRRLRRLALSLFKKGRAHLLGSDCHNVGTRPPNLASARAMIEKRLGASYLMQIDHFGKEALNLHNICH